jgi:hypothetical protein
MDTSIFGVNGQMHGRRRCRAATAALLWSDDLRQEMRGRNKDEDPKDNLFIAGGRNNNNNNNNNRYEHNGGGIKLKWAF